MPRLWSVNLVCSSRIVVPVMLYTWRISDVHMTYQGWLIWATDASFEHLRCLMRDRLNRLTDSHANTQEVRCTSCRDTLITHQYRTYQYGCTSISTDVLLSVQVYFYWHAYSVISIIIIIFLSPELLFSYQPITDSPVVLYHHSNRRNLDLVIHKLDQQVGNIWCISVLRLKPTHYAHRWKNRPINTST